MRFVSVAVRGVPYVPAPPTPTPTFFRYVLELGELAFDAGDFVDATRWYLFAIRHAPPCCAGQAWEVSSRFFDEAARLQHTDPPACAAKFRAGCEVLKGTLP